MKKNRLFVFAVVCLAGLILTGYSYEDLEWIKFPDFRQGYLLMEGKSIKDMDLRDYYDVLIKVTFDTFTEWPPADKLPGGFNPQEILEIGKDPGLGIRELHKRGITGKGVKVAIIDQPLLVEHEEYRGKVKKYTEIDCVGFAPTMHGAAVASLFVGEDCGVAPGAYLYYWAEPSWENDYNNLAAALDHIIQFNKGKSLEEKIRVVSVSKGYAEGFMPAATKNLSKWIEKLQEAEENGIIVVHVGDEGYKFIGCCQCPLFADRDNPENYTLYHGEIDSYSQIFSGRSSIYIPIDNRTQASFQGEGDYTFMALGGISWAPPYLGGIIALGLQVNPLLGQEEIYKILRQTGTPFQNGVIVNPPAFIQKIEEQMQ